MSSPIDNYRNYLARNYSEMKLPAGKPYGVIKLAKGYDFGFHVRKDHVSVHFISNGTHDPEEVMGYINDNGIGDKTYGDGLAPDVSRGKRNANVVRCEVHIPLESVDELRKPTLRKHSQRIFDELYDDFSGIVEGSEGSDKTEKVAEIKPESDDKAEVDETAGSDLTDEQIKEFKEQEKEAEDSYDYYIIAGEIAEAGDKDWARKLYQKAEDLAEDSSDYNYIADSVADEDNLGDKDWARKLYKKAEDLAEDLSDYSGLADSVADEDYLGDEDWARKLYKKAEDLAEDSSDYSGLADSVADEDYLGDKDWARKLYKKAEDLAEDPSDYSGLAVSVADEDYLGDKKWARELYDKALDSDGSFDDFKKLCTDYLDDKSIFDEEYFEKAFEKALGLKSSADEYDINSFADSLKEAGETDKLEKLKEPLNIEIGITHNIEINGDSVFRCSFDIDFNYYEEQTGDEGPERFEFDYDFKNGVIVNYNYNNAELDCVRIPYEDEAEISSCWYLGQSGEYMNDDYISMQGNGINDVEGEHAAEMEEIVKTINSKVFKELASAALNRIKGLEGIN